VTTRIMRLRGVCRRIVLLKRFTDMTKIVAPPHPMNMADRVTYGMVACVFVLAVIAFVYWQ
jgi:hypothetical protein